MMPCYIDSAYDSSVDLNYFVAGTKKEKVVYCNKSYPITSSRKGEGWEKLLKYLQKAAMAVLSCMEMVTLSQNWQQLQCTLWNALTVV